MKCLHDEFIRTKTYITENTTRLCFYFFSLFSYLFLCCYAVYKIQPISPQFCIASGFVLIFTLLLIEKTKDELFPMIFVLTVISLGYFIVCPFEMPPDEPSHFKRAFEISCGGFFSRQLSSGQFGDILPNAINDCWNRSAIIDWNNRTEVQFSNTALYSFVNYVPQAIGIFVARIFTSRVAVIYYFGRFFNFLTALTLSIFALKRLPFGRKILFVILLFPMTLQEMISLSPDALVNALSFVFLAFILNCAYEKETISRKDIFIISCMLVVLSLCKIVYIGTFFLIYIIPNEKLSRKSKRFLKIFVPIFAILLNLSFLLISMKILANARIGSSNAKEQVKFILAHPISYGTIFVKTIIVNAPNWIANCVGSALGWLNIGTNFISWGGFLFLLVGVLVKCYDIEKNVKKGDMLSFILTFFSGLILILTSEYVGWTEPHKRIIEGVQGRYFIPILSPLFFSLIYINYFERIAKNFNVIKTKNYFIFVIVILLSLVSLVDVCKFYPDISKAEKVTSKVSDDFSTIVLTLERMHKFNELEIAVWSEIDGQDDLQWFLTAEIHGLKKIEYAVPLKNFYSNGKYFVHVYGTRNGNQRFLTNTELTINFPKKRELQNAD